MVTLLSPPSREETESWVSFKIFEKKQISTQIKNSFQSKIKVSPVEGGLRGMILCFKKNLVTQVT
jgi:hypothetical protein